MIDGGTADSGGMTLPAATRMIVSRLERYRALFTGRKSNRRLIMAKGSSGDGVYRVTEVIGTSTKSWEDAAQNAVTTASKTLRDLRIAEVSKLDMKCEGGKVVAYRARVQLSFKYDA